VLAIPQELLHAVGGGDGIKVGESFLRHFIRIGGLQPHHQVLDVGCGCGRMALPLTQYLSPQARYEGFDINPDLVRWTQENITPRYANFRFQRVDLYNRLYNPRGLYRGSRFNFPYPDKTFDFVFLTSVFTHLLPRELANYMSEVARVLKVGGRVLATFFLLNPEAEQLLADKKALLQFPIRHGICRLHDPNMPEAAVAYQETSLRPKFEPLGLSLCEPIHYGSWSGRSEYLDGQDIIVAEKTRDTPRRSAPTRRLAAFHYMNAVRRLLRGVRTKVRRWTGEAAGQKVEEAPVHAGG
jgi:SAM-dependent methyltransferase